LLFIHQGLAPFTSYLHVLLGHLSGNLRGQEIHSFTYQSLDSLLSFLFVADPIYNPMPAVDAWYLKTIFKWISIVLIGWMVWRLIERQTKSKWEIRISIALVGLAILFPASATYHFILFLIPFSFIVQRTRLLSKNERIIFYALSLMTFNLIPGWIPALEGSQTLNVLVHYPRLFGLLALFVWMYFRTMKQLNTNG
jgi:heme A synthase